MQQSADKILNKEELLAKRANWKAEGQMLTFTNGCFDILHLGHVHYLEQAAAQGDKLVVALNTDASVKKLKGEQRPINHEMARARIIAALGFVDAVVLFEEDTPLNLITALLPDILVKGSDYKISNIVGADIVKQHGGRVNTIDLVEGFSTTSIINKINQ